jgi:hypothetical protein
LSKCNDEVNSSISGWAPSANRPAQAFFVRCDFIREETSRPWQKLRGGKGEKEEWRKEKKQKLKVFFHFAF